MPGAISAGTAWVDILPNMAKFRAAMASGLAGVAKSTGALGKKLTTHVTLPIVAAGAASIKLAVDFERTFEMMVGLAGVAEEEVAGLKETILELAPAVGKSPLELAKALYFIRSAGLEGNSAVQALVASAKLSAAGLGDTEVVADALTSAINAYGKANLNAAQAGDILAATVREGKGEADAIAPVLGSILPLAQRLGVGFDQVGASIAAMTRIGESAPRAATALRGLFTSLLSDSPKVKESLAEVGLTIGDLQTELADPNRGLPSVLLTLEKAFGGNIQAIRRAFPNIRGLSGLLELTGKNGKATQEIMDKVADSAGTMDNAFEQVTKGEGFKFEKLMATIRVVGIRLGLVLLPIIADIATHLTGWLESFQKLSPETKKFILIALGVAAVLGPVLLLISGLATVIGLLISPVGLVILAVAALVAAFVVLYTHSETVREAVGEAWTYIQETARRAVAWYRGTLLPTLRSVLDTIQRLWARYGSAITSILRTQLRLVVSIITRIFNIIRGIVEFFLAVLRGDWSAAWGALKSIVRNQMGLIVDVLRGLISVFFQVAKLLGRAVWDGIKAGMSGLGGKIKSAVRGAGSAVLDLLGAFASWGSQLGHAIIDAVVNAIKGSPGAIVGAIKSIVPGPLQGAVGFLDDRLAAGGPAYAGGTYLVGERGPELFQPNRSGTVIPNHLLGSSRGRQAITITNWDEGTGYMEEVADGVVGADGAHRSQIRRMHR